MLDLVGLGSVLQRIDLFMCNFTVNPFLPWILLTSALVPHSTPLHHLLLPIAYIQMTQASTLPPVLLHQLSVRRFDWNIWGAAGFAQFSWSCQSQPVVLCCFCPFCRGSHLNPWECLLLMHTAAWALLTGRSRKRRRHLNRSFSSQGLISSSEKENSGIRYTEFLELPRTLCRRVAF